MLLGVVGMVVQAEGDQRRRVASALASLIMEGSDSARWSNAKGSGAGARQGELLEGSAGAKGLRFRIYLRSAFGCGTLSSAT